MRRRRYGIVIGLLLAVLAGWALWGRTAGNPILRSVPVGGAPLGSLIDERTGRAFIFGQGAGALSIVDTHSGVLSPTAALAPSANIVSMSVDEYTGRVFLVSGDGGISMLDGRNGAVLHTSTDTDDTSTRGIAVDARTARVFVGHRDSATVTMLDARSGMILSTLDTCFGPGAIGVSLRTSHVFVRCDDGTTAMLDARTGQILQTTPTYGAVGCARVDETTNRVFVTAGDLQQLDVLDARTGRRLRTVRHMDSPACPAVDARTGRVYIALDGPGMPGSRATTSQVAILDGRSGAVMRRVGVAANPGALAVDSRTGHVLVSSIGLVGRLGVPRGFGTLSVLDGVSGQVVRTIQTGVTPTDVAIDGRAGRAVVVNSASDVNGYGLPVAVRPNEGWWPRLLRDVKRRLPWLPFTSPAPPPSSTTATVTIIDLARL